MSQSRESVCPMCSRLVPAVETDEQCRARMARPGYVECEGCNGGEDRIRTQDFWLEAFGAFARGLVLRADRFAAQGRTEAAEAVRECAADLVVAIKLANAVPVRLFVPRIANGLEDPPKHY